MTSTDLDFTGTLLSSFGLEPQFVGVIAKTVKLTSFSSGQVIPMEDREGPVLSYVCTGTVLSAISLNEDRAQRQSVMAYSAGQWIGAKNVMTEYVKAKPSAEMQYLAAGDVSVMSIGSQLVQEMMNDQETFKQFMLAQFMNESVAFTQILLQVKYGGPVYRVISGLAILAESFTEGGCRSPQAGSVFRTSHLKLSLSQSVLAELFGISRSAISPVLGSLATHGWLYLEYGQTILHKPDVWCKLSERLRSDNSIPKDMSLSEAVKELSAVQALIETQ